jgi:hypothetical protein
MSWPISRPSVNGALILSTNTSPVAGRTLQFFFDNCLVGPCSPPTIPPSTYLNEKAGILTNALRDGAVPDGGMLAITTTEGELSAWIKIDIPLDTDPAFWNVCFDSRKVVGPCAAAPGGTSTDARIRRDAPDQWTIYATTGDRADLIRDSQSRRDRTFSLKGTYSMPFSFTVQCVRSTDCPAPRVR